MNKREKRLAVVIFLLMASFLVDTVASASRVYCLDSNLSNDDWVEKHLASSAFVLLAEVVDFRKNPWPFGPDADADADTDGVASMKELLELIEAGQKEQYFLYEAVLLTHKTWKGAKEPRLKVYYNALPGNYGFELSVGERFLIFGHELPDGRYSISTICDQTVPANLAAEKIRALDDLISREPLELSE